MRSYPCSPKPQKLGSSVHRILSATMIFLSLWLHTVSATAITVATGATYIPRGEATGSQDITVNNGIFAVAFAVESAPPWGVARGGIVDIAMIENNQVGNDIASLVDFMPNNWSPWPTSYQTVNIIKQTDSEVIIRTQRDWGKVKLDTRFHIRDEHSIIHITTTMTNAGKQTLADIYSGYVAWPDGGYLFGVTGLSDQLRSQEDKAYGDWSAAYDENWLIGLHAPFANHQFYQGRDRYLQHQLKPGQQRTLETWLQLENQGDLSQLVAAEIDQQKLAAGTLTGEVRDSTGKLLDKPSIVILKDNKPYTWAIGSKGRYQLRLPEGSYSVFATAKAHSPSSTETVVINKNETRVFNPTSLHPPGKVELQVMEANSQRSLDARISVTEGYKPLIKFMGDKTFFTELSPIGKASFEIAPGQYTFSVNAGGGFTAPIQTLSVNIEPGKSHRFSSKIPIHITPASKRWYAVDLHHHSDVLDGFTKPEYVLRSELAAGMDFSFLSDHDSMANNAAMQELSQTRSIPFIAGTELSPSWAHFNVYPISPNKQIDIDVGTSTVDEIFDLARRLGGEVIHVNHPFGEYGYFQSLESTSIVDNAESNAVPGGYNPKFDTVEITSGNNHSTMKKMWQLWNNGHKAYLVGGSDVHDVWNEQSGASRSYVHITENPNAKNMIQAIKQGHSYATQGPLIVPDIIFGSEIEHPAGEALTFNYTLMAVNGLKTAQIISNAKLIEEKRFDSSATTANTSFTVIPDENTWYSLVVEDSNGKFAYGNPVWVRSR